VFIPLVTPFDDTDRVDVGALEALADELLDEGVAGLVALATTGEPSSLDSDEQATVLEACSRVRTARHATLIVGVGTNDTRTALARHEALAEVPGVSASLAVVPYYVRPTEAAVVRHFQTIAERSPVPVLVYNIPYRTGRELGAQALVELAAIDNIAGVKQAVGAIDTDTLTLLAGAREKFAVLGGDDAFLFPLTLMGGPARSRPQRTCAPAASSR
jgi:4-hydroxy-tetrahydrodipicolinate synthase